MSTHDVVVVGAGAAGSATACALAGRGLRVAVVEQFALGHDQGSSHGNARIMRLVYDDALYARMAVEAMRLWREVEADGDVRLLTTVGGLDAAPAPWISRTTVVLSELGVRHELLDAKAAHRRWPHLRLRGSLLAQPDAARVDADLAVATLQRLAAARGVELHSHRPVTRLEVDADGVVAHTPRGLLSAPVAVVTAGAWTSTLLAELTGPLALTVTQEQVLHLQPRDAAAVWPAFISLDDSGASFYGLPTPHGIKIGEHAGGPVVTPATRGTDPEPELRERVLDFAREQLPGLGHVPDQESTCLYTNTVNEDFVLDRVGPVVVGSACSGHGFKFTPLIGRLLADLAVPGGSAGQTTPSSRFSIAAHQSIAA